MTTEEKIFNKDSKITYFDELIDLYGHPDPTGDGKGTDGDQSKMGVFPLPYHLVPSWNHKQKITRLYMNKDIGPRFVAVLEQMREMMPVDYIRMAQLDRCGGCFNIRKKRGNGAEYSLHSFGLAIDYCPDLGPFRGKNNIPQFISSCFENQGFMQLESDPMHFQPVGINY